MTGETRTLVYLNKLSVVHTLTRVAGLGRIRFEPESRKHSRFTSRSTALFASLKGEARHCIEWEAAYQPTL